MDFVGRPIEPEAQLVPLDEHDDVASAPIGGPFGCCVQDALASRASTSPPRSHRARPIARPAQRRAAEHRPGPSRRRPYREELRRRRRRDDIERVERHFPPERTQDGGTIQSRSARPPRTLLRRPPPRWHRHREPSAGARANASSPRMAAIGVVDAMREDRGRRVSGGDDDSDGFRPEQPGEMLETLGPARRRVDGWASSLRFAGVYVARVRPAADSRISLSMKCLWGRSRSVT